MATVHYNGAELLVGGLRLKTHMADLTLNHASEMLDQTAFGDSERVNLGGLKTVSFDGTGHVDYATDTLDSVLFTAIGADTTELVTVFAEGVTAGSTTTGSGYGFPAAVDTYTVGGAVGSILDFTVSAQGRGTLAKATALSDFLDTFTTCGENNGTVYDLGAVESGKSLYSGLHITGVGSTEGTAAVLIQSASSSGAGFTAAATTRVTFTTLGFLTGEPGAVVVGPSSTDEPFWRAQWTVSSSAGDGFKGLAWMGIQ